MALKHLLKRGALLAAANWQTVAIQFVAQTTFQVLLAVPIIGAAILVAVLLGADIADLLQGSLREMFTTIASALLSEPVALVAFMVAFIHCTSCGTVAGVVDPAPLQNGFLPLKEAIKAIASKVGATPPYPM